MIKDLLSVALFIRRFFKRENENHLPRFSLTAALRRRLVVYGKYARKFALVLKEIGTHK